MSEIIKKATPTKAQSNGSVKVWLFAGFETVCSTKCKAPIGNANITIRNQDDSTQYVSEPTHEEGYATFSLPTGNYSIELPNISGWDWNTSEYQSRPKQNRFQVTVIEGQLAEITFTVPATITTLCFNIEVSGSNCNRIPCADIVTTRRAWLKLEYPNIKEAETIDFFVNQTKLAKLCSDSDKVELMFDPSALPFGEFPAVAKLNLRGGASIKMAVTGTAGNEVQNVKVNFAGDADIDRIRAVAPPPNTNDLSNLGGEFKTTTTLTRTETSFTPDIAFWTGIRNGTEALSFNNYLDFMDIIFCVKRDSTTHTKEREKYHNVTKKRLFLPFTDSDAYRVLKAATEAFVMVNCGVLTLGRTVLFNPILDNAYLDRRDLPLPEDKNLSDSFDDDYLVSLGDMKVKILPYLDVIRRKLPDIPIKFPTAVIGAGQTDTCFELLQDKLTNPCLLELIWSYWHEEGMLVQTMNTITRRFQNMRSSDHDPLSNLEVDSLHPLNNLLWGYIQDEQHRLTVTRRNYEYDHHYGLHLEGKAVQNFRPADTRSKFLEAFHHLLRLCTVFYKQDDDTTVKADAFPILNALKEVHIILSQGAHNQFGDLPSTARIEMLMQQWLLARPEFREFLPTRLMVAHPEPWMDRVDAMKKIQGWTDTSILHFRNLGMFGEQLLLSIRWDSWSDEFEPVKAFNWTRFHRPQVQGYIHAYRAATGVDLSADPTVNMRVDSTLPSVLLQKQLASQRRAS